jgi:hypothetical protein
LTCPSANVLESAERGQVENALERHFLAGYRHA